jgi:hypothetical protein
MSNEPSRKARLEAERDEALTILNLLVTLKDGPRDDVYLRMKPEAWAAARKLISRHGYTVIPKIGS